MRHGHCALQKLDPASDTLYRETKVSPDRRYVVGSSVKPAA